MSISDGSLSRFFINAVAQTERPAVTHILVGGNAACKTTFRDQVLPNTVDLSKAVIADFDAIRETLLGKNVQFNKVSDEEFSKLLKAQLETLDHAFKNKTDLYFETFDYDEVVMQRQKSSEGRLLHVYALLSGENAAWERFLKRENAKGQEVDRATFDMTHEKAKASIAAYAARANKFDIYDTTTGDPEKILSVSSGTVNLFDRQGLAARGLSLETLGLGRNTQSDFGYGR